MKNEFTQRIDRWTGELLRGYRPTATGEKVIHDPIWGSVVFSPWEVRLIDSPLLQRLRSVNQVGLAQTTYPAARHTRFEHSLGVAAIASRMMEKLRAGQRDRAAGIITEEQIRLVRLAALLHDVGHCAYSHLSEAIYGRMPEFIAAREAWLGEFAPADRPDPKPHEMLSYFIITSPSFGEFFCNCADYPGVTTADEAQRVLKQAANLVVGVVNRGNDGTRYSYLTAVINGNFDADKLDYTQRDSYTAGIALAYGVERFLLKLVLCRTEENGVTDYRLGLTQDALSTVEELVFNRSMLYHYMYRHQKVLAAEAQMRDALYALVKVGEVKHPCDFLSLQNEGISARFRSRKQPYADCGALPGRTLRSFADALDQRRLMKRAMELSPEDFSEENTPEALLDGVLNDLRGRDIAAGREILRELLDNWQRKTLYPSYIDSYIDFLDRCSMDEYIAERRIVAEKLAAAYRAAGKEPDFDAFDFAISFQPPLSSRLRLTIVDKGGNATDADDAIRRIERWTETLNLSKWRGYLFVSPHVDRDLAAQVFLRHLKER